MISEAPYIAPCRLPGVYQWSLSDLYAIFPHFGESEGEGHEKVRREFGALGHSLPHDLTSTPSLPQVIYKKFQLGCAIGHNETEVERKSPPSLNTSCEAQMFTADSQVGVQAYVYALHLTQVLWFCHTVHSAQSGARYQTLGASMCLIWRAVVGLGGWGGEDGTLQALISCTWATPPDVLHSAHYGFCFCLPP